MQHISILWSVRVGVLLTAILAPRPATAQATTVDGAQALVRGDYDAALRILQPLAEDPAQPDPLAQTFLAMLYAFKNGAGETSNACRLYLASATGTNPLADQSRRLARAIQDEPVPPPLLCVEGMAPFLPMPSTTFTLAPDHRIIVDAGGATVEYHGTQKQLLMTNGGVGDVFLPLRYTPLDVSQPAVMRRHFIQMFSWSPETAGGQTTWMLGWGLLEVTGADARFVAGAGPKGVMSIVAPQPPSIDIDSLAQVLVGTTGEAEWIILTDPPQRGVIPVLSPRAP